MDLFANSGIFLYPLAACSFLAVFVAAERLLALRTSAILPRSSAQALMSGNPDQVEADRRTVIGRIVGFCREQRPDAEALRAFARLEVSRMERGLFLLEVVVGAAPLLGLLGTVTGLTQVFGGFSIETGLPEPGAFIAGIALALNTTILGLAIAIPALAAHAYLMRRVDSQAARISVVVACLIEGGFKSAATDPEPPNV
ncbi:MAG: MotA/TolQ/ExbB proton channel family protein [Opitutales bacterium]